MLLLLLLLLFVTNLPCVCQRVRVCVCDSVPDKRRAKIEQRLKLFTSHKVKTFDLFELTPSLTAHSCVNENTQ